MIGFEFFHRHTITFSIYKDQESQLPAQILGQDKVLIILINNELVCNQRG